VDISRFLPPYHHPLAIYGIIALLIIIIPLLLKRIKIPVIIGLIIAGIAIGPFGFHILEKDAAVDLPATIGILYIMFLAGLEIDLFQFAQKKKDSVLFGMLTFIIPLALGTMAGRFLIHLDWPSSVLLASMFSSHTLITYPTVSRFGLAKSRSSVAAVGGTIITDILAIIILAVVAGNTRGNLSYLFLIELGGFLIFTIIMFRFIIPFIGKWFFRRMAPDEFIQYAFILAMLFLFSFLAEVMGLEKIIGAFLAGLALNRLIPEKSALMNRVRFVGNAIFIPVFLISVGMLIDLGRMLLSPWAWLIAGIMSVTAVFSKAAAAGLGAGLLGMDRKEGMLLFGMSVNQAAATLAVVLVGYDLHIFNEDILSGTIFMILLTCALGTFVTERTGRTMALAERKIPHTYTSRQERFVIAVKDRKDLFLLLDLAFYIRNEKSREAVYPVTIISQRDPNEKKVAAAERLLTDAVVHGSKSDIPMTPVVRSETKIEEGLVRSLKDNRGTVLITRWKGPKHFYSGVYSPTIDAVLNQTRETVLLCRLRSPLNGTERIVVILPHFIEKIAGFLEAMTLMKTMAAAINARLLLYVTDKGEVSYAQTVSGLNPQCSLMINDKFVFHQIPHALCAQIQATDLIVLFSIRMGRPAWQPRLNRLPGILCRLFKNNNFVIMYPSEEFREQSDQPPVEEDVMIKAINPEMIFSSEGFPSFSKLISAIINERFSSLPKEDKTELISMIVRLVREEAVQMKDDVVLVHAHVRQVEHTDIYYILKDRDSHFQELQNNRVLIVLLSPKDQPPELHLQALSELVRLIRKDNFIHELEKGE
jgi:Kef-type K+ transport system membrane component KefB/mannitol/fructose-specific phosphotransferase system IIA component (Ntr-type)